MGFNLILPFSLWSSRQFKEVFGCFWYNLSIQTEHNTTSRLSTDCNIEKDLNKGWTIKTSLHVTGCLIKSSDIINRQLVCIRTKQLRIQSWYNWNYVTSQIYISSTDLHKYRIIFREDKVLICVTLKLLNCYVEKVDKLTASTKYADYSKVHVYYLLTYLLSNFWISQSNADDEQKGEHYFLHVFWVSINEKSANNWK